VTYLERRKQRLIDEIGEAYAQFESAIHSLGQQESFDTAVRDLLSRIPPDLLEEPD
jgi:hypothetical protein